MELSTLNDQIRFYSVLQPALQNQQSSTYTRFACKRIPDALSQRLRDNLFKEGFLFKECSPKEFNILTSSVRSAGYTESWTDGWKVFLDDVISSFHQRGLLEEVRPSAEAAQSSCRNLRGQSYASDAKAKLAALSSKGGCALWLKNQFGLCRTVVNYLSEEVWSFLFLSQIAGSCRDSYFSKGDIMLAAWPTLGCCLSCLRQCAVKGAVQIVLTGEWLCQCAFQDAGDVQGGVQAFVLRCCAGGAVLVVQAVVQRFGQARRHSNANVPLDCEEVRMQPFNFHDSTPVLCKNPRRSKEYGSS